MCVFLNICIFGSNQTHTHTRHTYQNSIRINSCVYVLGMSIASRVTRVSQPFTATAAHEFSKNVEIHFTYLYLYHDVYVHLNHPYPGSKTFKTHIRDLLV